MSDVGGDYMGGQNAAWAYMHNDLLPITVAWQAGTMRREPLYPNKPGGRV